MADREALDRLHGHWGGKIVLRNPPTTKRRGHKPLFYWRLIEKKKIVVFIEDILPFLAIKEKQAQLILDFISECKPIKPIIGYKGVPRMTKRQMLLRDNYHRRMKVLNGTLLES